MKSTSFLRAATITTRAYCAPPSRLIHFHDPRRLHYRGLFLPLGEFLRAFPINIHACEFLAVRVIHGYLPVMMLAAFIVPHSAGFLWLGFFHVR
jgi:hypothetical protein